MAKAAEVVMPTVLKSMPIDAAAEMLQYLADHEDFSVTTAQMGEDMSREDIANVLRELAMELRKIFASTQTPYDTKGCEHLSNRAKKILSCLSPMEEKTLLTAFGLVERR